MAEASWPSGQPCLLTPRGRINTKKVPAEGAEYVSTICMTCSISVVNGRNGEDTFYGQQRYQRGVVCSVCFINIDNIKLSRVHSED